MEGLNATPRNSVPWRRKPPFTPAARLGQAAARYASRRPPVCIFDTYEPTKAQKSVDTAIAHTDPIPGTGPYAHAVSAESPFAKRRPRDARIAQQAMSATVAELACIKSCKDSSIWSPILPPEHIIASSKRSAVSSMKVGKCFFMPNGLQPPWT